MIGLPKKRAASAESMPRFAALVACAPLFKLQLSEASFGAGPAHARIWQKFVVPHPGTRVLEYCTRITAPRAWTRDPTLPSDESRALASVANCVTGRGAVLQ